MSYLNIGSPRFYINVLEWLDATGYITTLKDINRTLPVNPKELASGEGANIASYEIDPLAFRSGGENKTFFAVLGHKGLIPSTPYEGSGHMSFGGYEGTPADEWLMPCRNIVNVEGSNSFLPIYNGFSIGTFLFFQENTHHITMYNNTGGGGLYAGSIIIGTYFTMSHSDLNLTLGYETGTKTIETRGGASLSNTMWRPPMWGDLGPWELSAGSSTPNQALAHSSRRIWNLSFSYLDKTNTFPKYNALNRYTNEDLDADDVLLTENETLLDSGDFYSQVWERCGTALPFIFQPDKDVPEFAIAKFTNNISFQQQAPGLYRISLKIREVW